MITKGWKAQVCWKNKYNTLVLLNVFKNIKPIKLV